MACIGGEELEVYYPPWTSFLCYTGALLCILFLQVRSVPGQSKEHGGEDERQATGTNLKRERQSGLPVSLGANAEHLKVMQRIWKQTTSEMLVRPHSPHTFIFSSFTTGASVYHFYEVWMRKYGHKVVYNEDLDLWELLSCSNFIILFSPKYRLQLGLLNFNIKGYPLV